MRIVLLPAGSLGGVHPLVGIGRALQNRGHDVTVITSGYHGKLVDRVGLHGVTFGTREDDLKALAANPEIIQQGSGLSALATLWRQTRLTGFPLFDEAELKVEYYNQEWETWLTEGDAPIVLLAGTANRYAQGFSKACVEACVHLGRRALILTRFPEQLPAPLPPSIQHVGYIPLSTVLPQAAAVVHHGGVGTLAQALRAGCPQLVMPFNFDQPDNSIRLAELGVGYYISPSRVTCGAVAKSLDKLLRSSEIHDACRLVASRFEGVDATAQTCDLIEALPGELCQSR